MGGACTKTNERLLSHPVISQDYIINQEFAPILSINHPFNVNKKYDAICEIIREQYAGSGIKKTHAYKTTLTQQEIEKKRSEFWAYCLTDTRTEGHSNSWLSLKSACKLDDVQGMAIIIAAGLKLVNKSIQISYDSEGHKYDVPIFCINDPIEFAQISKQEKFLIQGFQDEKVSVVGIEKDFEVTNQSSITFAQFKIDFTKSIGQSWKRFRFFLAGRELLDHHQLGNYKLEKDTIVQAFVSNFE